MSITIHITEQDIQRSKALIKEATDVYHESGESFSYSCLCPGALALARALKEKEGEAHVHYNIAGIFGECIYIVPDNMNRWIHAYDKGEDVQPATFVLLDKR